MMATFRSGEINGLRPWLPP
ncbi:rCG60731, isoform CRA_b, partial [Rattus norvegicus]